MKSYIKIIILHLFVLLITPLFLNAMDLDRKSEFFPLDVWEEMEDWNHNKDTVSKKNMETNSQSTEIKMQKVEFVNTNFPFDILKELNALDGTISKKNKTIKMNIVNPYWMPEELIVK